LIVLPPAEVFSFCLHTALTELASTSEDAKTRDQVKYIKFIYIYADQTKRCRLRSVLSGTEICTVLYLYHKRTIFGHFHIFYGYIRTVEKKPIFFWLSQ
jgi:hypothetical protein